MNPIYIKGMPHLSHEQIKAEIANGNVFAISIDTAIFDAKQKAFGNPILRRLDQFHSRNVQLVIVDVIASEMRAHLCEAALETQRALKKALRSHSVRWRREESAQVTEELLINSDASVFANREFEEFVEQCKAIVIDAAGTPDAIQQVFNRYFGRQPPFGPADKRKSEFPDAFALLRLESLAANMEKLLICVAPDKGWIDFARDSNWLVCVDRLEDALALFNAADQHLADSIVQCWQESGDVECFDLVSNAFEYRLGDLDFVIDATTDLYYEAEPIAAVLQYIAPETIGSPKVIAVDGETVTFVVQLEATIGFEAIFYFYATDDIDKDHVALGSEKAYTEDTLSFDITITAERSLENGLVFRDADVAKRVLEIDFGYVDAFPNEDPTHEKY